MWHVQGFTYTSEKVGEACGQETSVSAKETCSGRAPAPESRSLAGAGKSREIPRNSKGLLGTGFKVFGGRGAIYFPEIHTKKGGLNLIIFQCAISLKS